MKFNTDLLCIFLEINSQNHITQTKYKIHKNKHKHNSEHLLKYQTLLFKN